MGLSIYGAVEGRDNFSEDFSPGVALVNMGSTPVRAHAVEDALRRHPAVADVAVRGVASADWGEQVAASSLLATGVSESTLAPL